MSGNPTLSATHRPGVEYSPAILRWNGKTHTPTDMTVRTGASSATYSNRTRSQKPTTNGDRTASRVRPIDTSWPTRMRITLDRTTTAHREGAAA
ncbi:hypothetical protein FHX37_4183 [Haloactinospora alba]|uniref:Uncharacterized protein n=1 Tax=Haloactinospora alba TaxID=405555 RepID=A0A543NAH9_9ACTN|nr:hypothetical protein FHX37_4183 [Haloactinospora alba]